MKKTGIMKTLYICALLLLPSSLQAQKNDSLCDKPHRMWEDLDLKDDQKAKLIELHKEAKTIRSKRFETVRNIRLKIKEELTKQNPSTFQLDAYASELGDLHREIAILQNNHMLKVKAILSDEQFSKLVSRGDKFEKHRIKKGKSFQNFDKNHKGSHGKKHTAE